MHKKLLLVGYLPHDSSIYAYATSFVSPLQKLGFEVKNFNYRDHFFKNNWFKPFRIINHYLINRQLLKTAKAFKPDIVFCIKAETITPQTLIAIKKQCNSYLINFHPDSPFALWNGNSTVNIIRSFRIYDHFLTWSHELAPALVSAGCKKVSYFPFAFDKELYVQAVSSLRPFAATADKPSCPARHSHLGKFCWNLGTGTRAVVKHYLRKIAHY